MILMAEKLWTNINFNWIDAYKETIDKIIEEESELEHGGWTFERWKDNEFEKGHINDWEGLSDFAFPNRSQYKKGYSIRFNCIIKWSTVGKLGTIIIEDNGDIKYKPGWPAWLFDDNYHRELFRKGILNKTKLITKYSN